MDFYSYAFTFIEGILTFVSPCLLPILPAYFFFLAGVPGNGVITENSGRSRLVANSVAFVIGFTIVFVTLGAAATSIGHFLREHLDIIKKISGIVMVVLGLNFMGILKLKFLNVEKRLQYDAKELNFLTAVVFGMVFAFGWTPCLGTFLGSALLLAGSTGTLYKGILLLLTYSVGLGIPFIVTAVIFDKAKDSLKKLQKHSRIISAISGIVLVLTGILVFTDSLKYLGTLTW